MEKFNQVLDYASTEPNGTIQYHASNMILMTDKDAAYLVLPAACGLIEGHYCFIKVIIYYSKGNPTPNGPIFIIIQDPQTVVSSSDEAETCGTFESE